jgi:hypothetical protein
MRGSEIIRSLSFSRARPPRADRAEPRLLPPDAPLPFRRPGDQNPGILSTTPDDAPPPPTAPAIFIADLRPAAPRRPAGSLRDLALAGCVVLGVGAVAGAGFMLLTPPSTESGGSAAHNAPEPAPPNPPAPPASSAAAATAATATAAIPGAADAPPAGTRRSPAAPPAAAAPDLPPVAHPQSLPGRPSAAKAARAYSPVAKFPRTAVSATGVPAKPIAAEAHSVPDNRTAVPPTEMRRPAHPRTVARHVRLEGARGNRGGEPQSRSARFAAARQPLPPRPSERPAGSARSSAPPQADQAASFDRLMNQLTGPGRLAAPTDQSLSPPAAGAPDPFGQRGFDK